MTIDEALAMSRARTVDLWARCDRRQGETPESLREQALDVLAAAVESLREDVARRDLTITLLLARLYDGSADL